MIVLCLGRRALSMDWAKSTIWIDYFIVKWFEIIIQQRFLGMNSPKFSHLNTINCVGFEWNQQPDAKDFFDYSVCFCSFRSCFVRPYDGIYECSNKYIAKYNQPHCCSLCITYTHICICFSFGFFSLLYFDARYDTVVHMSRLVVCKWWTPCELHVKMQ